MSSLSRLLEIGIPLEDVDVSCNMVTPEGLGELVRALPTPAPALAGLNLSMTGLSDLHVNTLCDLVGKAVKLESLNLSKNGIGKRGLSRLIEVMTSHPRLRCVNVNANQGLTADHLVDIDKLTTTHDTVGHLVDGVISEMSESEGRSRAAGKRGKAAGGGGRGSVDGPQSKKAGAGGAGAGAGVGAGAGGAGAAGAQLQGSGGRQPVAVTQEASADTLAALKLAQQQKELQGLILGQSKQKPSKSQDDFRVHSASARFSYGTADTVGRRNDHQDVMVCLGRYRGRFDEDFFGVYDGHGGIGCAEYVGKHLHGIMSGYLAKVGPKGPSCILQPAEMSRVMCDTYKDMAAQIAKKKVANGSTAACVYFGPKHYAVANIGDSRVVLCRDGVAMRLTVDHKPDDPAEEKYIRQMGGFVSQGRVNGMLAVSRAFGDLFLAPTINTEPHVVIDEIHDKDEFMIIACDGVFDVLTDQAAVDVIRACKTPKDAAALLKDTAYHRGSTDNISVIVLSFVQGPYPAYRALTRPRPKDEKKSAGGGVGGGGGGGGAAGPGAGSGAGGLALSLPAAAALPRSEVKKKKVADSSDSSDGGKKKRGRRKSVAGGEFAAAGADGPGEWGAALSGVLGRHNDPDSSDSSDSTSERKRKARRRKNSFARRAFSESERSSTSTSSSSSSSSSSTSSSSSSS